MWHEKEANQFETGLTMWPCPLTTLMTLVFDFKVNVWYSFISGMCQHNMKGIWSFVAMTMTFGWTWWGPWMYRLKFQLSFYHCICHPESNVMFYWTYYNETWLSYIDKIPPHAQSTKAHTFDIICYCFAWLLYLHVTKLFFSFPVMWIKDSTPQNIPCQLDVG